MKFKFVCDVIHNNIEMYIILLIVFLSLLNVKMITNVTEKNKIALTFEFIRDVICDKV